MDNLVSKRKIKVTIGVLVLFIGICLLSSTYLEQKKFEVFDEMNELYYDQLVEIEDLPDEIAEGEELPIEEESDSSVPDVQTPVVTAPVIDYSKYYVGYLTIPKIDLKNQPKGMYIVQVKNAKGTRTQKLTIN